MSTKYRFRFNPLMILLTIVFFSVFTALSLWQVGRVYEKQQQQEVIDQANAGEPLRINNLDDEVLLQHRHYRARVNGQFLADSCFFVENVIQQGKPGLYRYCPFRIDNDQRVLLVNMGWIARPKDRLQIPQYSWDEKIRYIEGVLTDLRSKPVVTSGIEKPNIEKHELWAYFDFDSLKQQSGLDFYPLELRLTSVVDDVLLRKWPKFEAKIGMHIGYAIHWAAFALVVLGLFIKFNITKQEND